MTQITPQTIPFGEWLPDQQALDNNGAYIVRNVIPEGADYKPFKNLSPIAEALPDVCRGAYTFRDLSGTIHTFAATETNLYKLNSSLGYEDVSKSGGYTSQNDIYWKFINYGNLVIACNYTEPTQSFNVSSSTDFDDLDADAPQAKFVIVLRDFVVMANTFDGTDGAMVNRVRWSGLNAPTQWTVGTNSSDFQDLQGSGGEITGIVNIRSFAAIIMEREIWRMDFVGGQFVFRFEKVVSGIGSRAPNSVVSNGEAAYFLNENGFFVFDGQISAPIGDGKVDRYFFDNVDPNFLYKVSGSVYPNEKVILWIFKSVDAPDENPDKIIGYSWGSNRWFIVDQPTQYIFPSLRLGETLDGLDALYTSIDDIEISLDSSNWSGGASFLAGIDGSNRLGSFSGSNKEVLIESAEFQLNGQGRSIIYGIKPVVDTQSVFLSLGYRDRQADTVNYTDELLPNSVTEECDFNVDARYHRARMKINEGVTWNRIRGVKPRAEATGGI